jgi:phosphoribosylamine-glycine ligase
MIVFISNSGEILPVAYRLQQVGEDVTVYIHNPAYRLNYNGLLEKTSASKLPGIVKRAQAIIFDIVRPNEGTQQDITLLKVFRCHKSAPEVFGAVADKMRRMTTAPVISASTGTSSWELDRKKGEAIAKSIGIQVPETYEFTTLREGAAFLKRRKDRWVFKPSGNQDLDLTYVEKWPGELRTKLEGEYENRIGNEVEYILQQVVEGVELSTESLFDGQRFTSFNHTFEEKKLMTGDLGPAIGSQNNVVWIKRKRSGLLVKELTRLTPLLTAAGYVGPIDVNCIVSEKDRQPYFLEFSTRFGWDAFYCLLTLLDSPIKSFLINRLKGIFKHGYAASERITIPPFPYQDEKLLKNYAKGVNIVHKFKNSSFWAEDILKNGNNIECAGADGILGVVTGYGLSIKDAVKSVYSTIEELRIASTLQYRTDLGKRAERDLERLKSWGISVE